MAKYLRKTPQISYAANKELEEEAKQFSSPLDDILYGPTPQPVKEEAPRPMTSQLSLKRAMHSEMVRQKYGQGVQMSMEFKPNDNRLSPIKGSNGTYIKPKDIKAELLEDKTDSPEIILREDLVKEEQPKEPLIDLFQADNEEVVPEIQKEVPKAVQMEQPRVNENREDNESGEDENEPPLDLMAEPVVENTAPLHSHTPQEVIHEDIPPTPAEDSGAKFLELLTDPTTSMATLKSLALR